MEEYFNMFWEKWFKMEQELPINSSNKKTGNILTYFNNNKKLLISLLSAFFNINFIFLFIFGISKKK